MPDLNDFYAFKNTSNRNGGSGKSIFFWILVILAILEFIGKIFN